VKNNYTLVLTHDVDFLSLKNYSVLSKTTLKFTKDCIFTNMFRLLKGDIHVFTYLKSLFWGISYPFIKLGWIKDPWEKSVEDILKIEKKYGVKSTFFFIPFENKHGFFEKNIPAPQRRKAKYDVNKYKHLLKKLEKEGWEVGIHGINAHLNGDEARKELIVFKEILPQKDKWGVRVHWLYQPSHLWMNLKETGYYYDSTFGSNEEIGFKDNRYVPFKKDGIWVLPTNIQDTTLLSKWRKNLSYKMAWDEIKKILELAKEKNAVVTIIWHNISFGPPRYWGSLYEKIIEKGKKDKANFVKAIDVLKIFN